MNYKIQESRILKGLDSDVIEIFKKYNCCVAGGTVVSVFNNSTINDYDIYSDDIKKTTEIVEELKKVGFELMVVSKNSYSLQRKKDKETSRSKLKVQIIKYEKFCNSDIAKTLEYFDFNCCMGAYNFKDRQFYLDEYFLSDNIEKKLRFNIGTEYPICSLYRTLKYQKRGYILPGIEIIKIALAINNLHMKTYQDLKDQLMGIDTQFLQPLTDILLKEESQEYDFQRFNKALSDFYGNYYEEVINKTFGNKLEEFDEEGMFDE